MNDSGRKMIDDALAQFCNPKAKNCHCPAWPFPHRRSQVCDVREAERNAMGSDERECGKVRDSDRAKDAAAINGGR